MIAFRHRGEAARDARPAFGAVLACIDDAVRVASKEDTLVHVLDGDSNHVSQQVAITEKLHLIDHWGKLLTVLALLYGLVLAGFFLYQGWLDSSHL